jgi:hypothetical protein
MENLFFTKKIYIFAHRKDDTMRPRTSEEIKALLQQTKERKLREAQERRKQKQEEYKRISKLADNLLQEDKKRQMDNIKALAKKASQKPLKQPQIEFEMHIYNSNLIEREPNDRDLYTTREELQEWEENNWKCINWELWDKLVQKARQEL